MQSRCPEGREPELVGLGGIEGLASCSPLSPAVPGDRKTKSRANKVQSQITYVMLRLALSSLACHRAGDVSETNFSEPAELQQPPASPATLR